MTDIKLSPLDEERFGMVTAKVSYISGVDDIAHIDQFCAKNAVKLVIARVDVNALEVVQALEDRQYRLMDTLVYWVRDLNRAPAEAIDSPFYIRDATRDDIPAIGDVAAASFAGYAGHYHADPNLPPEKCDEVYIDWAKRSVTDAQLAGCVRVVEDDGEVIAFMTYRTVNGDGEIVLGGILPEHQRRGIYQTLLGDGIFWCSQQGAEKIWFSTQITNVAVQRVWTRLHFVPHHAQYTLHRWYQ